MSLFCRAITLLSLLLFFAIGHAEIVQVYPDQDFEASELKLSFWPENSKSTMHLDREIFYSGQQSLRVEAPDSGQRFFALQSAKPSAEVFPAGTFFTISVMVRKDANVEPRAITYRINFRVPTAPGVTEPGKINHTALPLRKKITPAENGWEKWHGYFQVPKGDFNWQFLLGVEHTEGRVWFDNVVFEKVDLQNLKPDVWTNWTLGVETGSGPAQRWSKHQEAQGAVATAGKRYNSLLWKSAEAETALRDARRAATYANRQLHAETQAFAVAEQLLQAMYEAYDTAFTSGNGDDWNQFEQAANRLENNLQALNASLKTFWGTIKTAGLPPKWGRQPRSIKALEGDGRLNRLLIGVWSPAQFNEVERPFDFEFQATAPGHPRVFTEDQLDFSNITAACDRHTANGFAGTFSYLLFGLHDQVYAPAWFYEKHKSDPDFARTSWDGHTGRHRSATSYCLNFFHPTVKSYIHDYLTAYATYCAREPRVLFYEFAPETNMNFATEAGSRSIGYGASATQAFQKHLRQRYQTIAAVNTALGTNFADFNAALQPPDPMAQKREKVTPLDAEYEIFREDSYMDYLGSMHQALKAADPDKPTVARFSGLITDMNGARAFEVCDIVSHHCRAPRMQMAYPYLNSMNRHYGRALGYMEDFWGCQDAQDRVDEERIQRRGLEKHMTRTLIWGRTLQMKWYSYTSGAYIFTYNGNWLSLRHDLTTMRYCAPALGIAMRKMENFDWVLTHSVISPGRVLLLQPSASRRNLRPDWAVFSGMQRFHTLLEKNGFVYESLPEEFILDGRVSLTDFDAVLLPTAPFMANSLQTKLATFVNDGGTLIAAAELPQADELARPSDAFTRTLLPAAGQATGNYSWAQESTHGRGRLLRLTDGIHFDKIDNVQEFVKLLKDRAGRVAWADGAVLEVILRHAEDGNDYLFVQNPDLDNERSATIRFTAPCQQLIDASLPGGVPLNMQADGLVKSTAITLGPAETAVLWLKK